MDNTRNHDTEEGSPAFSFATESPWVGLDVETMRVQARARVLQSKQRANSLGRHNTSLRIMLEAAHAQRIIEGRLNRDERRAEMLDDREARRERNALLDLAAEGSRPRSEPKNPRRKVRHVEALRDIDRVRDISLVDEPKGSQDGIDLRDRDALTDLRRRHEMAHRESFKILNDAQPRSAAKSRRWG